MSPAGCARGVTLAPGPNAPDPACAVVIQALPRQLAGLDQIETTAQASVAWGSPAAAITLRCGVAEPPPTTERCLNVARSAADPGVDWVNPESDSPLAPPHARRAGGSWTFISYGRTPAVEVVIPAEIGLQQPVEVLQDLAGAVGLVPAAAHCVGATDVAVP